MINWRTIVGVILLLVSIRLLYIIATTVGKAGNDMTTAKIGCIVWMAVGVFFIVRGTTAKKER